MGSDPEQTSVALRPFGASVFARMSALAAKHGAINLGQGFPDFDAPPFLMDRVADCLRGPTGQYVRSAGLPILTHAIALASAARLGYQPDPDREIVVTTGATEGIAASILGLVNPGDEVILLDPGYDSYAACVAMAGGTAIRLRLDPISFDIPWPELERAVNPRTRLLILNSPHNPSGRVFTRAEQERLAQIIRPSKALVLSDEVYEHLVFEGESISFSTLEGMRERTIVLSSLGKTFSCTGWKIGWAIAPEPLARAVQSAHQFLTFCAPAPFQAAAAAVLHSLHAPSDYLRDYLADYRMRLAALADPLEQGGLEVRRPQGTYFMLLRTRHYPGTTEEETAGWLVEHAKVATIPLSPFSAPGSPEGGWVRLAFCKGPDVLREAAARLVRARG